MSKRTLVLAIAAAVLASCAHEEVTSQPADRDWTQGLDGNLAPQIAPLGPLESDQGAYDLVRRRERERALGSKLTAAQLDEIIAGSSQVLASALARAERFLDELDEAWQRRLGSVLEVAWPVYRPERAGPLLDAVVGRPLPEMELR